MYPILEKRRLNETTTLMRVLAPRVAKKAGPGQFIILRIDENGERIPLTIAGYDRESGSVTIIFQKVGKTTIHPVSYTHLDVYKRQISFSYLTSSTSPTSSAPSASGWMSARLPSLESTSTGTKVPPGTSNSHTPG